MVNVFCKRLFNATVYMEFWVCFAFAKCESNAFFYSKPNLHQLGPFKLIKTMLKSLHVL